MPALEEEKKRKKCRIETIIFNQYRFLLDDSGTIEKSKYNAFYEQKYLEDFNVYVRGSEGFQS